GATWTYSTTQKHAVTEAGSASFNYSYDLNGNATARQGNSIVWLRAPLDRERGLRRIVNSDYGRA
ncbi:MAG: hypothetical protein WA747_04530, partial [Steroidobacteraceae bacterium]